MHQRDLKRSSGRNARARGKVEGSEYECERHERFRSNCDPSRRKSINQGRKESHNVVVNKLQSPSCKDQDLFPGSKPPMQDVYLPTGGLSMEHQYKVSTGTSRPSNSRKEELRSSLRNLRQGTLKSSPSTSDVNQDRINAVLDKLKSHSSSRRKQKVHNFNNTVNDDSHSQVSNIVDRVINLKVQQDRLSRSNDNLVDDEETVDSFGASSRQDWKETKDTKIFLRKWSKDNSSRLSDDKTLSTAMSSRDSSNDESGMVKIVVLEDKVQEATSIPATINYIKPESPSKPRQPVSIENRPYLKSSSQPTTRSKQLSPPKSLSIENRPYLKSSSQPTARSNKYSPPPPPPRRSTLANKHVAFKPPPIAATKSESIVEKWKTPSKGGQRSLLVPVECVDKDNLKPSRPAPPPPPPKGNTKTSYPNMPHNHESRSFVRTNSQTNSQELSRVRPLSRDQDPEGHIFRPMTKTPSPPMPTLSVKLPTDNQLQSPAGTEKKNLLSKTPRVSRVENKTHVDQHGDAGLYTGEVNEDGLPHGKGKMKYDNGIFYEGKWNNGSQDSRVQRDRILSGFTSWKGQPKNKGKGEKGGGCTVYGMDWIDLSGMAGKYTGNVNDDNVPDGRGVMRYDFGLIAEGEWIKGVLNGGSGNGQIAGGATIIPGGVGAGNTVGGGFPAGMSVVGGGGMSVVSGLGMMSMCGGNTPYMGTGMMMPNPMMGGIQRNVIMNGNPQMQMLRCNTPHQDTTQNCQ